MAEVTFRNGEPAIDVKDHKTYHQESAEVKALIDALPDKTVQAVYERAQSAFWDSYAPNTADAHGYGGVYSEGRSSGWLLVDKPPVLDLERQDLDGTDLDTEEERLQVNRAGWDNFEREIEAEIEECRAPFYEGLSDALVEHRATDRRVKAVAAMSPEEVRDEAENLVGEDRLPREELDRIVLDYGDPLGDVDEE
jgi:hypothetical protein